MYHHRRVVTGQPLDYIELLSEVVYIDALPMSRGLDEATDSAELRIKESVVSFFLP